MTTNLPILPIVMHMTIALLLLLCWRKTIWPGIISVAGNVVVFILSIYLFNYTWEHKILITQMGSWPAPFGITIVMDVFSSLMVLLTSASGLAVSIFATGGISKARIKYGFFPIFHFLLMGLNGAFLTGDLFNLYVWFEVIIISSFVLLTLGGRKPQLEGAINYVAMNLLASVIFLTAIGILYGLTGSLNMADLSEKVKLLENRGIADVTALLFFIGFGIKSALFPLYFWLPSSYHTPPSAIGAIFAGLLTKVGIYALIRIFTLIFIPDIFISNVIIGTACMTLVTGAFGALIKRDIRKMFSYLIVCHIGYMVAGLGMYTETAIAGSIFYLIHDIIIKTNVFLVSGLIFKIQGTFNLQKSGGLLKNYPSVALVFSIVLFSLVGIPPLSGFWPKINLFKATIVSESYLLLACLILASFITLFVVSRMWSEVFWKEENPECVNLENSFESLSPFNKYVLVSPVVFLAAISVYIGFGAEKMIVVSNYIAKELLYPENYIKAVMEINNY